MIDTRLATPTYRVPLADLPARWCHGVITIRCVWADPRDAWLANEPALVGKLRGAWGNVLMAGASPQALAGAPCPWDPPCALDIFLRPRGAITARLKVPQPYVFAVGDGGSGGDDGDDGDDGSGAPAPADRAALEVRLMVFGFAIDWMDSAAAALVAALRQGLGGSQRGGPSGGPGPGLGPGPGPGPAPDGRRRLEPISRTVTACDGIALPPVAPDEIRQATLTFHTPLCLRSGGAMHGSVRALFTSLGNRISGLARWQDTLVEADWSGLKAAAARLDLDERDLAPSAWPRVSARQDRAIPMQGLTGRLVIRGDLAPFLPLLMLGATCHAGSHTALGLGRYTLELG